MLLQIIYDIRRDIVDIYDNNGMSITVTLFDNRDDTPWGTFQQAHEKPD